MLDLWSINNFKSFKGENSFEFKPLTLLCGANSSGKSTVLQSILLVKQTIQHSPAARSVALNGPLVRLGTFNDIENDHVKNDATVHDHRVGFGWTLNCAERHIVRGVPRTGTQRLGNVKVGFEIDAQGPADKLDILQLQPNLRRTRVSAKYEDHEQTSRSLCVELQQPTRPRRAFESDTNLLPDESVALQYVWCHIDGETKRRVLETYPRGELIGCIINHFFPQTPIVRFDSHRRLANQIMRNLNSRIQTRSNLIAGFEMTKEFYEGLKTAIRPSCNATRFDEIVKFLGLDGPSQPFSLFQQKYNEMPFGLRRPVRDALTERPFKIAYTLYNSVGRHRTITPARSETLADAWDTTQSFFRFSVNYLGPLRDEPKPSYPLMASSSPTDVGPKGEMTAAALHLNERRRVKYVLPSSFQKEELKISYAEGRLKDAVVEWLAYLGVADEFATSEKGKLGHELMIRTPGSASFQDLTNVGVGVSQILPIVVTCLLAEPSSLIILEQPELHLHPAVQARLADFFISMSFLGKQCLIETHGEYLVERIRLRVVLDKSDQILNGTQIYAFQQMGGITKYSQVRLTRYGAIKDWPPDFFDQSQRESERIVMMALKRRKAEKVDNFKGRE